MDMVRRSQLMTMAPASPPVEAPVPMRRTQQRRWGRRSCQPPQPANDNGTNQAAGPDAGGHRADAVPSSSTSNAAKLPFICELFAVVGCGSLRRPAARPKRRRANSVPPQWFHHHHMKQSADGFYNAVYKKPSPKKEKGGAAPCMTIGNDGRSQSSSRRARALPCNSSSAARHCARRAEANKISRVKMEWEGHIWHTHVPGGYCLP